VKILVKSRGFRKRWSWPHQFISGHCSDDRLWDRFDRWNTRF